MLTFSHTRDLAEIMPLADKQPSGGTLSNAESESGLLSLPPKLRDRIYELVLIHASPIPAKPCECRHYDNVERFYDLAITQVNQQVRSETLPILYGRDTFRFYVDWVHLPLHQKFAAALVLAASQLRLLKIAG